MKADKKTRSIYCRAGFYKKVLKNEKLILLVLFCCVISFTEKKVYHIFN
jgi:hypothetical protein